MPTWRRFLSGFVLGSIDGSDNIAYVDNQLSGEVYEDPEDITRLRHMFEVFHADALRAQDSIDFIRRVAAELWTEQEQ